MARGDGRRARFRSLALFHCATREIQVSSFDKEEATSFRRAIILVLIAAGALIAVVLILYFGQFGPSGRWSLSPHSNDWNDFGAFVGGSLAPALSFLGMLLVATTINLQLEERRNARRSLFQTHFFQALELHARLSENAKSAAARSSVQNVFSHALDMIHAQTMPSSDLQHAYNQYRARVGAALLQALWAGHALVLLGMRAPGEDRDFYARLLDATFSDEELELFMLEANALPAHLAPLLNLQSSDLWERIERLSSKRIS